LLESELQGVLKALRRDAVEDHDHHQDHGGVESGKRGRGLEE